MELKSTLGEIQHKIALASRGRSVRLIGVTKTFPAEAIRSAYEAGLHVFGENRIQEAIPKLRALEALNIEWHFIGHLQTNKAREAVRNFVWIQSVDSIRLMQEIEKQAARLEKKMNLLFEIHLGGEETKHGFAVGDLHQALEASRDLKWSKVRGLMCIPPYIEDTEQVRPYFRSLRNLQQEHSQSFPGLVELSMGMSHDFETAIEEGATMVRLGTAIFGSRSNH